MNLLPRALRGYQRSWLAVDLVAGATLAAVAIPETMGYTSIAQTPVVTGLYTVIFPTVLFALIGSSRLLVVGADSATAAILAAGLAGVGIAGLTPNTAEWLAWTSLVALVCGVLLLIARLLRLGFIGDFLSASVLIGFLTGVGIQVLSGQIPDMLGVGKGTGNWFEQQWHTITEIPHVSLTTAAFALGTVVIIVGCKRFAPRIPGAIVAVILSIILASVLDAAAHGVAVVGEVQGGFPPIGLPDGITWSDAPKVVGIAFSCFVLIVAQSAATSRSFALKHGQQVDVNRDILALSGANFAAGLSGTFVVNGSPTKTEILDEQKGRTQVANLTMSAVVLLVVLFFTGALTNMPKAVLAGIVFLIGLGLVDIAGLKRIGVERRSEFVIACITAVVVFGVGVEQGIVLAIVLSILEIIRRAYGPADFVVGMDDQGNRTFTPAAPGAQSEPGLVVFRYDAELFYANASRFTDDVEAVMQAAPDKVRWLLLDCSSISDVDYSAGVALAGLIRYVQQQDAHFGLVGADARLLGTLASYGVLDEIERVHVFDTLEEALAAYRADTTATTS
ncbi:MAG TPA: SulP family inorganic anion transporter [Mycobacteriales bacterium]